MGRPKAWLDFGGEKLLQRVTRVIGEVAAPVVVVAAADQSLPSLPDAVIVVCDARPSRGPLEGMAAGLRALKGQAETVFVASCDAPLLTAPFVERVVASLEEYDVAVPELDGRAHPLAAAYRFNVLATIEAMLAADRLRPTDLVNECRTRRLPPAVFADVDPELLSLRGCNTPEEYESLMSLSKNRARSRSTLNTEN